MNINIFSNSSQGTIEGKFSVTLSELVRNREKVIQDYILKEIADKIINKFVELHGVDIMNQITPQMLTEAIVKEYEPDIKIIRKKA
jgi:hypothetical protein